MWLKLRKRKKSAHMQLIEIKLWKTLEGHSYKNINLNVNVISNVFTSSNLLCLIKITHRNLVLVIDRNLTLD